MNSYEHSILRSALRSATTVVSYSDSTVADYKHLFHLAMQELSMVTKEEDMDNNSILSHALCVMSFKKHVHSDNTEVQYAFCIFYWSFFVQQFPFDILKGTDAYKQQQLKKWPQMERIMLADLREKEAAL